VTITSNYYLVVAALIFTIGAVGVLVRRNVIVMFMCVELMLNAVNLTFVAFAKELIEAYPEAKVVLTNRDVHSWHASTMKTVYWRVTDSELRWLSHFDWAASMYYPMLKKFFDTFFEGDFPNKGKDVFNRHYAEVRSIVPKERLLEYKVTEGWEPLCKFLGEPIPKNSSFPNVNDNSDFVARSRRRNRNQMYNCGLRYIVNVMKTGMAATCVYYALVWFRVV